MSGKDHIHTVAPMTNDYRVIQERGQLNRSASNRICERSKIIEGMLLAVVSDVPELWVHD